MVDTNESEGTGSTRALAYSLAGERPRHFAAENRNIFRPYTGPCSHLEQNNDIQNYKTKITGNVRTEESIGITHKTTSTKNYFGVFLKIVTKI